MLSLLDWVFRFRRPYLVTRLREVYSLVGVWTGVALGLLVVSLVGFVLGFVYGESDWLGWVVYVVSGVVVISSLGVGCIGVIVKRWLWVRRAFDIDLPSGVVFRFGEGLGPMERFFAEEVAWEWVSGRWGEGLQGKLSSRFSEGAEPGGWFGDTVWVTLEADDSLGELGSSGLRVIGVASGAYVRCALLGLGEWTIDKDAIAGDMLRLVEHELAHIALNRLFPGSTGDEQHKMMKTFL